MLCLPFPFGTTSTLCVAEALVTDQKQNMLVALEASSRRSLTTWDTAITWETSGENVQRATNEARAPHSPVALNEIFV